MFRDFLMFMLAVLFFGVSSVDAQLFRRFAQPANYGQAYQQQAQQATQNSDCTCNQQNQQQQGQQQQGQQQQGQQQQRQQQQRQQQQGQQQQNQQQQRQLAAQQSNYYRAPSTYNRRSYNAQLAKADQPSLARQTAARTPTGATRQQQQSQPTQPQRYALYYNPRTNQTILRPIRSAIAGTSTQAGQRGLFRQPQVQAVQPQVVGTPVVTRSQVDVARQPVVPARQVQPVVNNLSLNAPRPTAATPVASPPVAITSITKIEPAIAAPTGTLTSSPNLEIAPAATQPKSATPKKAFSILESSIDSKPELGGPVEDKN